MKIAHLLLIPTLVFAASDVPLDFAPSDAQVSFTLDDVLHTVHGTFLLKQGNLVFDPDTGKASGVIIVDAKSGNSGSSARDRRMHANILESEKYPEIVFRPERLEGKVAAEGISDVTMHGVFSIHGADHEIAVPVHVEAGREHYMATARFDVPYVKWGMKNPSTFLLRVSDKVQIDLKMAAQINRQTAKVRH